MGAKNSLVNLLRKMNGRIPSIKLKEIITLYRSALVSCLLLLENVYIFILFMISWLWRSNILLCNLSLLVTGWKAGQRYFLRAAKGHCWWRIACLHISWDALYRMRFFRDFVSFRSPLDYRMNRAHIVDRSQLLVCY